ncbi:MAG: hypothetical protein JWP44_4454 [Mucilaginibacter sp.]|jgi:hypothetical protein|nr:hypothetical protein [Mucilaginibacter sp.]
MDRINLNHLAQKPVGDPIYNLFANMPSSEAQETENEIVSINVLKMYQKACLTFQQECLALGEASSTAEYEHLKQTVAQCLARDSSSLMQHLAALARGPSTLRKKLAALAVSGTIDATNQNPIARHLRYIRWAADGRRDETSPFVTGSQQRPLPTTPGFLPLPQGASRCAACGKENGTVMCTGCRVTMGGYTTYGVSYCNKQWQTKHWTSHKAKWRRIVWLQWPFSTTVAVVNLSSTQHLSGSSLLLVRQNPLP